MRYKVLSVFCLLFSVSTALADEYTFDYDANCNKAYQFYMSLHIAEGNAMVRREIIQHPYNLMSTYLADYDDCLLLLLNCDKKEYEQRKSHLDARLELLEQGDENSPWQRLCRAGIYLHWALVHVRLGDNFKAATLFRKSYLLIKENNEKFPSFEYNKVFLGLEETVVGTIPDNYKWIASMFGMKGNVRKGIEKLEGFISKHNNDDPLQQEAIILHTYLKFYLLSQQPVVWNFLNSNQFPTHNNLLFTFVKANIAVNYRKADETIETLREAERNSEYNNFPIFHFEMASALLYKQDPASITYFKKFLNAYKGKLFVKDAWQKMGLAYYLEHDMKQANYCMSQIIKQGNAQVDADKQAMRFAEKGEWPNITLLQARLYLDGGYYKQALEKLNTVNEHSFSNISDKLEYCFRLGRACDELGSEGKALQYYQQTINMGRDHTDYFAARAALQMAFIFEHTGRPKEALERYRECLSMHNHDFQSSIDQQAKAGVNRLTVK